MRDCENLAGSKLKITTVQRILEQSDKSPFDKGGFRGNVDALITRKGELFYSPFLRDSGGIRTHDPQLRRLLLYPAELRNHHIMFLSDTYHKPKTVT